MWNVTKYVDKELWEKISAESCSTEEWYCDYECFGSELQKDLTSKRLNIFIPGGGFSTLACDLVKQGYKQITHSDINSNCIKKMKQKYHTDYPTIKYMISYSTNHNVFDTIIDKALFDSFLNEDTEAHRKKSEKYFKKMARIIRPKGKFILISLGKPFVLTHLLHCFNKYFKSVKIILVPPKEFDIATKPTNLFNLIPVVYFVFSHRNLVKETAAKSNIKFNEDYFDSINQVSEEIQSQLCLCYIKYKCCLNKDIGVIRIGRKNRLVGDMYFIIASSQLEDSQADKDYLILTTDEVYRKDMTFFVVEFVINFAKNEKTHRICFAFARFNDFTETYEQATHIITDFAYNFQYDPLGRKPKTVVGSYGCNYLPFSIDYPIEYLSPELDDLNDIDFNRLQTCDFIVVTRIIKNQNATTDVSVNNLERQLFFKSCFGKIHFPASIDDEGNFLCDKSTLEYHWAVLVLLATIECDNWKIVHAGFGMGKLSSYISVMLPISSIVCIESNKDMILLAMELFGFEESSTLTVVNGDKVKFISLLGTDTIDCIIYDVNDDCNEQANTGIPSTSIDKEVLINIYYALNSNGVLILNVLTINSDEMCLLLAKTLNIFPRVYSYRMKNDQTSVVVALKNESLGPIKVNIPKLISSDNFQDYRKNEEFKTVLKYLISDPRKILTLS